MAKASLRAYNREIEAMIDRGQLDEAVAHCHHILKTFPKHLETYRLLGKAYLESKRYGDAVDVFSRVLASVPNDFVAHVGLSIIRDEENKLDDAIWHMERAFETQPSNSAIQSELQRLYGRRDGIAPPRIRMTRGALAHMYVQGELYPQAISEIKSVLKEDPGRSDMQALLARANFRSGAKNDAVDAALNLLQRLPYALDGNRVLAEVLSADRNENAQSYRQRVVELDPYAGHVTGSIFQSNEVAAAAVTLERLDWNGQPVGMGSDWRDAQAIGLESARARDEQPDWLKTSTGAVTPPPLSEPTSLFSFDTPTAASETPTQPANEIPDFLKVAGWGQSTGSFDESQSMFAAEEPAAAEPLAQGDLPDWVKAMKPPDPEPAAPAEQEELPDWINKIGAGALGSIAAQTDWSSQPDDTQSTFSAAADEQPDWLKGLGNAEQPTQAAQDQPGWLQGLGESQESVQPVQDQFDWLKGPASESEFAPQPAQTDTPDWLKGIGAEPESQQASVQSEPSDMPDWIKGIESESELANAAEPAPTDTPDWLQGIGAEPESQQVSAQSAQSDMPDWIKGIESEPELANAAQPAPTDTTDWLQGIGAEPESQQATAQPAQSDMPDWMKDIDSESELAGTAQPTPTDTTDWLQGIGAEPESQQVSAQPAQSDMPDWMKGIDAESGSEFVAQSAQADMPDWIKGLDSEPELAHSAQPAQFDMPDSIKGIDAESGSEFVAQSAQADMPDWIKGLGAEPELANAAQPAQPDLPDSIKGIDSESGSEYVAQSAQVALPDWMEELGSEPVAEIPLQSTQADVPASMNMIGIEPESEVPASSAQTDAPDWLSSAPESTTAVQQPVAETSESVTMPAHSIEDLGKSAQEQDDSFAWLENLAAKQGATEGLLTRPEERMDQEPEWVKQAKGLTGETSIPEPAINSEDLGKSEQERDDSFAWLENLAAKQGATEGLLTKPEERLEQEPEWVKQAKSLTGDTPAAELAVNAEELGKSEQERDDSFAWLEALAAKQGATEGLLTEPEERLQEEPDWVKQARDLTSTPSSLPVEESTVTPPTVNVGELGKSEQEQDDSFAWLESLAAKQGATEGLLTNPEERLEEEPDWVKHARSATPEAAVSQPTANAEDLGKSEQERDDSFAWLEGLAAKQGASEGLLTKPEERMDEEPEWVRQAKQFTTQPLVPPAPEEKPGIEQPAAADDTVAWLESLEAEKQPEAVSSADATAIWFRKLDEEEKPTASVPAADETALWLNQIEPEETKPAPVSEADETSLWLKSLEQPEAVAVEPPPEPAASDIPAWIKEIDQEEAPAAETSVPGREAEVVAEQEPAQETDIPSWLSDLEKEEKTAVASNMDDLPDWLRDETGEAVAEPFRIEPTRSTDWKPSEPTEPEVRFSPIIEEPPNPEIIYSPPLEEPVQREPEVPAGTFKEQREQPAPPPPEEVKPAPARKTPSRPQERGIRTGPVMPGVDAILGAARSELSRSNIPGALESYARLIKKGRFLDEVIHDLRDALYRYPVEVSIWQSLGDAYMRANRLQDALDAYTKAEELLR